MMTEKTHAFPVRKSLDSKTGKWKKHPAVPKGQDWREYKATAREMEHSDNIGVVIPDGVLIIDIDTHKGVTLAEVEAVLNCQPDWDGARVQKTVSGGEHYAFAIDAGVIIRQGSDLLGVSGFDTRCPGRGWICTGHGYTDLTMLGLPKALAEEPWPGLPEEAVTALLGAGKGVARGNTDDLEQAVASASIVDDLGLPDARAYLAKLPEGDVDAYDTWLRVGMALCHQYGGDPDGFELWREWSEGSASYDLDELTAKWDSFQRRAHNNPTTFAYIIGRAGGKGSISQDRFEALLSVARAVDNLDSYQALKEKVRSVDLVKLPGDLRGMLAAEVAGSFGKKSGLSKTEIKSGLMPAKRSKQVRSDDAPEWAGQWVYIESLCEFANTDLNYQIRREAFNAKYDREPCCVEAEKTAAQLALVDYRIPTVVDKMYWPGADTIFIHNGKDMLNGYFASGVEPCAVIDADGQGVIDMLMEHVRFTLSDPREQGILLDWLTFVIQNPGKRVNWALLLQGAQGTGKSYFVHLLQMILGEHVCNLDPTAIAGRFTGWAHGSLVVAVEEIRISGTNRYEVLDRLKPFITNPTVQIEEKGRDHRTVPNFTSYLMLTNHKDAIPLTAGDRRYGVLFSRVQSEQQLYDELGGQDAAKVYFETLFGETTRRADALAAHFKGRTVSAEFSPYGRAPETEARRKMTDAAISPERMMVEDAISQHECTVINGDVVDLTWLNDLSVTEGNELPKTRAMSAILLEMGYEQVQGRRIKISATRKDHYVWSKPEQMLGAKQIVREFHDDPDFVPF